MYGSADALCIITQGYIHGISTIMTAAPVAHLF